MCQVQWISKSFRWREAKIFFKENTGAEGLGWAHKEPSSGRLGDNLILIPPGFHVNTWQNSICQIKAPQFQNTVNYACYLIAYLIWLPFPHPLQKELHRTLQTEQLDYFGSPSKHKLGSNKNTCKETIWLCILIPELLYFFLYCLISLASGELFSIHEKLISGVVHAHNPVVFP